MDPGNAKFHETPDAVDLYLLVRRGDRDAVHACLLETPALLHRVRWSGIGPLHRAVVKGDVEMTQLLLAKGAMPNVRAAWGWYTPLHLACKAGNEQLIWLLLDHGAQWKVTDKYNKTPLQWAVKAGKASIAYRVDQQLHARAKASAVGNEEIPAESIQSLSSLCL